MEGLPKGFDAHEVTGGREVPAWKPLISTTPALDCVCIIWLLYLTLDAEQRKQYVLFLHATALPSSRP